MEYLNESFVKKYFPQRREDSHKGDYGRILLLCGSLGYTGAAALAAMGSLRVGAGLVYLAVPECIYAIEAVKLLEPIVLPLPDKGGMISSDAAPKVMKLLNKMDAVLIGPGLGCSEGTLDILQMVLREFTGPVVVDADGINLLAKHKDILRGRNAATILTPHPGEFLRFWGDLEPSREGAAMEAANANGVIMVLKGRGTVVTDGNRVYLNTTGNPGMAVGGSGDVLAGIIAGLLGQGIPPLEAAACGVWLHGKAGDLCAEEIGQAGMLPSDILNVLPRLLK